MWLLHRINPEQPIDYSNTTKRSTQPRCHPAAASPPFVFSSFPMHQLVRIMILLMKVIVILKSTLNTKSTADVQRDSKIVVRQAVEMNVDSSKITQPPHQRIQQSTTNSTASKILVRPHCHDVARWTTILAASGVLATNASSGNADDARWSTLSNGTMVLGLMMLVMMDAGAAAAAAAAGGTSAAGDDSGSGGGDSGGGIGGGGRRHGGSGGSVALNSDERDSIVAGKETVVKLVTILDGKELGVECSKVVEHAALQAHDVDRATEILEKMVGFHCQVIFRIMFFFI